MGSRQLRAGELFYLTGGTTGAPKLVRYDAARYAEVIDIKARMLEAAGVSAHSRVLVMHPMPPWAIGQVFADGALACGAAVLPVGITLAAATLSHCIRTFRPNVVCAGARNLLRAVADLDTDTRGLLSSLVSAVFCAGEKIGASTIDALKAEFDGPIYNVYGCAEMDALGIQLPDTNGVALVPEYQYSVTVGTSQSEPTVGAVGELVVKRAGEPSNWHATGDIIRVLQSRSVLWRAPVVEILGRQELRVKFGDGSAIGESQVLQVRERLALRNIQLYVRRTLSSDEVYLRYSSDTSIPPEVVERAMLDASADFADALQAGCIGSFAATRVQDDSGFHLSERQKLPTIFVSVSAI